MATPNVLGAYELLRRAMQQHAFQQQGADTDPMPLGAPEYDPDGYGSPQGGLLGRLLALHAEKGQRPFSGADGGTPSAWQASEYGETPRTRITVRPQIASDPSNLPDDGPKLADSQPAGIATPPERSFFDRLQASWDHPHPHGLLTILKDTLNGMELAVQGSIASTSTPAEQTEADVFRQNQTRELGPIGAWMAVRSLVPSVPRGAGGVFARPLGDFVRDGLPPLSESRSMIGQRINGQVASNSAPAVRLVSRNPKFFPKPLAAQDPESGIAAPAAPNLQVPARPEFQPKGGLFAQSPGGSSGQGSGGAGGGGGGGGSDDEGDRFNPDFDIFRRCVRAAKRNYQAWVDFCDDLPEDRKSKVGGGRLISVCQNKGSQPQPVKKGWCRAEFGPD